MWAQDLLQRNNKVREIKSMETIDILQRARAAKQSFNLTSEEKNRALLVMANAIEEAEKEILEANELDVQAARESMNSVMIDRLTLSHERILGMAAGIRDVAKLPDPVGEVLARVERPNGLLIEKVRVPLGVVAIIYESRPNVTSDAAALALKSGNVSVLRGGKEAFRSANAIVNAIRHGLEVAGFNKDIVNLVQDTSRQSANELMTAVGYVDLLIPRGGAGLIRACVDNAKVPCIETGTGICHIYVDEFADVDKALNIINNAKTSRPSVCNACEVCLVHESIADEFLPRLKTLLVDKRAQEGNVPVELRVDARAAQIINGTNAGDADFDTEFLNYILAVKVVSSVDEAINHIAAHSTHHSDAIISEHQANQEIFAAMVDSAAVYVNASTRFTDGGEFGLGCEMGISTQKLHARGPMGLCELTTYKYRIKGNGQVR